MEDRLDALETSDEIADDTTDEAAEETAGALDAGFGELPDPPPPQAASRLLTATNWTSDMGFMVLISC